MSTATLVYLMPREALYSDTFGELVRQIVGDLSLEQVAYRTGLSGETIRKMKGGKVTERQTISKFAGGMQDHGANLHTLLVAAGYEAPPGVEQIRLATRGADDISQEDKERVLGILEEIEERHQRGE